MGGVLRHNQSKMFTHFNKKKEEKQSFSSPHFRLVKLSLDWLLPSRASLRFALQNEGRNYLSLHENCY